MRFDTSRLRPLHHGTGMRMENPLDDTASRTSDESVALATSCGEEGDVSFRQAGDDNTSVLSRSSSRSSDGSAADRTEAPPREKSAGVPLLIPSDIEAFASDARIRAAKTFHQSKRAAEVAHLRSKTYGLKIIVAGESGLGKSTFINMIFRSLLSGADVYDAEPSRSQDSGGSDSPTLELSERQAVYQTNNLDKVVLTVVDFPGYGTLNQESLVNLSAEELSTTVHERLGPRRLGDELIKYIDGMNLKYYEENPTGVANMPDGRVSCCLFFMRPHRVSPAEICLLETLSKKVAVIPIIGKRDTMTEAELERHKAEIMFTLDQRRISCFDFSDEAKLQPSVSKFGNLAFPFAIISARSDGADAKRSGDELVREYPWGCAEALNPVHSDALALKILITEAGFEDILDASEAHYHRFVTGVREKEQRKLSERKLLDESLREENERAKRDEELFRKYWLRRCRVWAKSINFYATFKRLVLNFTGFCGFVLLLAQVAVTALTTQLLIYHTTQDAKTYADPDDSQMTYDSCFHGFRVLSTMCHGRRNAPLGVAASVFVIASLCLNTCLLASGMVWLLRHKLYYLMCCLKTPKGVRGKPCNNEDHISTEISRRAELEITVE